MSRTFSRLLLERIVSRTRVYRVYTTHPRQGCGAPIESVRVYDADSPPPYRIRQQLRADTMWAGVWLMSRRLRRREAVMLAYFDGDRMIGFGWLQRWRPLRREFWWLAEDGVCLGPYWTHPAFRGRGIYGRLLAHSLWECRRRGWNELYIWAEADNQASIRGIERAGFRSLGRHRVTLRFFRRVRSHTRLTGPAGGEDP